MGGHFGYVVSGHVTVPYNRAVCKVSKELTRAISFTACPLPPYGAWAELGSFSYHRNEAFCICVFPKEASKCPGGHQLALYHIASY